MQMAAIALRDHQPPLDLPLLLPQFTPLSQLRPSTYLPGVREQSGFAAFAQEEDHQ